ncbi:MAG: Flp pilus assembly protein CpaB [Pseudomonadota bacterium]
MRVNSVLLFVGALVLAIIATGLTLSLLGQSKPAPPPVIAQPKPEPKAAPLPVPKIVVAVKPLAFGALVTRDAVKEVPRPNGLVPVGSYQSAAQLINERRMVLSFIAKDEPILKSRLGAPGDHASLSKLIAPGMTAVAIRVDAVRGVAGFVQPRDRVDILLTRRKSTPRTPTAAQGSAFSDTLLQNVKVLAIDQIVDRTRQAEPPKVVTVEVTREQAQKIALAATIGQLSLALRGTAGTPSAIARRIGVSDLPNEKKRRVTGPVLDEPDIVVTRGVKRHEVAIPGRIVRLEANRTADDKAKDEDDTDAAAGPKKDATDVTGRASQGPQ